MIKANKKSSLVASSFRDPGGFLFVSDGKLYRQINQGYKDNYDYLMSSGLAKQLMERGLLISHREVALKYAHSDGAYKIIRPELVPFVSYPYEWCFGQLKDAALLTLRIQKKALDFDMSLKDASAFNIQFLRGKPILIDTLSFEKYKEGEPWIAYRQFCEHFLASLALMAYRDTRLNNLLRLFLDGIPLELAGSMLPLSARLKPAIFLHVYLHAKFQKRFRWNAAVKPSGKKMGKRQLLGLLTNLESAVNSLSCVIGKTEWAEYYEETNYTPAAFAHKKQIVSEFLMAVKSKNVWDLGSNTGVFSRAASEKGINTVSFDADAAAVEKNYLDAKKRNDKNILPLRVDIINPSPDLGWSNEEKDSLMRRGPVDTAMALALTHHLAISSNIPLLRIASFFSKICRTLIIEFVPKEDSNVQKLLGFREDVFPKYTQEHFERNFKEYFLIQRMERIKDSLRVIYLMKNK